MTVQTTMVTALSVVPPQDLARGSSLTNATRLVVQSIGVAILATVLTSTLSAPVIALQQDPPPATATTTASNSQPVGLCEVPPVPSGLQQPRLLASLAVPPAPAPAQSNSIIKEACLENVAGFERAYTVTFYAAMLAVVLGLFLPGGPANGWAENKGIIWFIPSIGEPKMETLEFIQHMFAASHRQMDAAMKDMTAEQFNWVPTGTANPISATYIHSLNSEDFFVQAVLQGKARLWEENCCSEKTGIMKTPGYGGGWEEFKHMHVEVAPSWNTSRPCGLPPILTWPA